MKFILDSGRVCGALRTSCDRGEPSCDAAHPPQRSRDRCFPSMCELVSLSDISMLFVYVL